MKMIGYCLSAALLSFGMLSCNTNNSPAAGSARLQIRLTDDPAEFDKVNIDVREIHINLEGDSLTGWKTLPGVRAGIYNLLDLVNDKDTLLADAMIPSGKIHQIRLVLGNNNTLEKDGQVYDLKTPSAQQSGLKLNIQEEFNDGLSYVLLLDFDAGRSITTTGNGQFILKPVIRTTLQAAGGSISGVVVPANIQTHIYAIQGADTVAGTATNTQGNFLLKALKPGDYSLAIVPNDTVFKSTALKDITVSQAQITRLDTVRLQ